MGVTFLFGVVGILLILFFILLGVAFTGLILLIIGIIISKRHKKKGIVKKYPKVLIVTGSVLIIVPLILIIHFILSSNQPMPEEVYEKQTVQVMETFVKQDADGLKETFLAKKQTDSLDEKIMEAFTYIEGDIVSYDQIESEICGGGYDKESAYDYYEGGYNHVKTSTGKEYTIYINSLIVWGKEKQSGVKSIIVAEEAGNEKTENGEDNSIKIE